MGGCVPETIMDQIASGQLGFEVHQESHLTGSRLQQRYRQVSQLHVSIPTSAVLESGLQQCDESDLDMILDYVPRLKPHIFPPLYKAGRKNTPDRLDHQGGVNVRMQG